MTKPLAWSFSSLDDFTNCPRAYYEKKVAKSVKEEESDAMLWGTRVHKMFEDRQKFGLEKAPLPADMVVHEIQMYNQEILPGEFQTEQKFGLDATLQPCGFFDKTVWMRGIIDYVKINCDEALIVDYKTGKTHNKYKQLALFALYVFAKYPDVTKVKVKFYWVQAALTSGKDYTRDMIAELWGFFVPNLRQYMEAFKTDTWQPRPSGLCNGWCPVKTCEFWKPKRIGK